MTTSTQRSLLPVVAKADNFPAHLTPYPLSHPLTSEPYVPFHLHPSDVARGLPPVGLLRPLVLEELQVDVELAAQRGNGNEAYWNLVKDESNGKVVAVTFSEAVLKSGRKGMEEAMRVTAEKWRDEGKFPEALEGWRNERYTVYAWPSSQALLDQGITPGKPFGNSAFALERSACAIWGFATFGVHMTAYEGEGEHMKIWVPRRSKTKATWPGMLDNTVAGGIPDGYDPIEAMIKECDEEANLPDHFVRPRLRNVGACTYFYITPGGFLQPELEYTYDLKLPPRDSPDYILPGPHDDEVESFSLMTIPEVLEAMYAGQFKPNCGLILVDFLIRHGLVTPENEPYFFEILWRTHRRLGVTVPA